MAYTSWVDSGGRLGLRYLTPPSRQGRGTAQALWEDVLRASAVEPDIVFAHPADRVALQQAKGGMETARGISN